MIGNIASAPIFPFPPAPATNRQFVKDVVGQFTTSLPSNVTYNYSGVTFNHIPGTEGTFAYTITVNAAGAATGQGSFSGVTGSGGSGIGNFTLAGTLHSAAITTQPDGRLGVSGGNVTATASNATGSESHTAQYDLGVFGPNAQEVAGGIYGGTLQPRISGYAFAGKR
ncbi:factor H binding protein domain-containing protein [Thauera sp. Sel9]|uniref:factor H binding protein domain-containing protein n=1 Tax=Thauera sp. Sel9 TaxID=2974299 RepID=UPI0021E1070D|nr:factor H binding protein domain-containing protein [Thauera sp. Sel9]MCV2217162.1 hypothetical protein [Thauera sp. Sel9]